MNPKHSNGSQPLALGVLKLGGLLLGAFLLGASFPLAIQSALALHVVTSTEYETLRSHSKTIAQRDERIFDLEVDNQKLAGDIADLEGDIAACNASKTQLKAELVGCQHELDEARGQISILDSLAKADAVGVTFYGEADGSEVWGRMFDIEGGAPKRPPQEGDIAKAITFVPRYQGFPEGSLLEGEWKVQDVTGDALAPETRVKIQSVKKIPGGYRWVEY